MDECYVDSVYVGVDSVYVSTPIVSQGKDTGMSKKISIFITDMGIEIMLMKNNFLKCVLNLMLENTDEEIWKEIEGLEGEYAISNKGNVKNLKTGRIRADRYNRRNGYKQVHLKGKNYMVHRLVALAFIPNPNNLPQVNHIDEDKLNNDVKNLEWVSIEDNIRHSIHNQSCKVKQLDKDGNLIRVWDSIHQINRELGYARQAITRVCKGKQEYSYGFRWEYCDPKSQRIMNRPVVMYRGNDYIGTFASATKASEALGLRYRSVSDCLKGRLKSTHGYQFKYLD